ncbi:MAG: Na+/H+ antiporter NhaA [Alphaproteobacteria bacterium]|nr:Na+/H+ antiporter NhaA [Alphaproteobacteria bacterium]
MFSFAKYILKLEAAGGVVLMLVACLAMAVANSPLVPNYDAFVRLLAHPINDGLMVLFFLVVGIEIKRECKEGQLATWSQAALPLGAALGGVVLPALIYVGFNRGTPALHGWAIPSATDIAFSLGVLALFGSRVPISLKIFLMALAVIDDLAAIIIIALFYAGSLAFAPLVTVVGAAVVLAFFGRLRVKSTWPYLIVGVVMWLAVLNSGIHATIAGVVLGLLLPMNIGERVLHKLHPYVVFAILPLFAFANAGVPLAGIDAAHLMNPITLGIALGLIIGKPLGIFAAAYLLIKTRVATLPMGASYGQLFAVAAIAGIGFTMSLFIGTLAFSDASSQLYIRLGVLGGSLVSALMGAGLLAAFSRQ